MFPVLEVRVLSASGYSYWPSACSKVSVLNAFACVYINLFLVETQVLIVN